MTCDMAVIEKNGFAPKWKVRLICFFGLTMFDFYKGVQTVIIFPIMHTKEGYVKNTLVIGSYNWREWIGKFDHNKSV